LDEVLAVGDLGFVIKCLNKMRDLANQSAVVFVSHTMPFVSMFCNQALLMQKGQVQFHSNDVADVIENYNREFALVNHLSGSGEATVEISEFSTIRSSGNEERGNHITVDHGQPLRLTLRLKTQRAAYLEVYLHTVSVIPVVGSTIVNQEGNKICLPPGEHELDIDLGTIDLNAGKYPLMIAVADLESQKALCRIEGHASLTVKKDTVDWGFLSRTFRAEHRIIQSF
jgi:lipopolysaccharide transport system ATP-binding protein